MTHTYSISGMTCTDCQAEVERLLSKVNGVNHVSVDLEKGEAAIEMNNHVSTTSLQAALKDHSKYHLSEVVSKTKPINIPGDDEKKTWVETYKPILLVFGYLTAVTVVIELANSAFVWMRWMNHFMGGFFVVFSFFKMLNLHGFAESYSMYDVVAKKWKGWGYVYAFVEAGLGIAFLAGYYPEATNIITFLVMTISIIGVLQSVMNKRKIKCACLGDVFNLPMSTVTIIEDGLMICMSVAMLMNFYL